jgi:asparagine synthase (glutamine-hydrolysing)
MRLFGYLGPIDNDPSAAQITAYARNTESREPLRVSTAPPAACWGAGASSEALVVAIQGSPVWMRTSDGSQHAASPADLLHSYRAKGVAFLNDLTGRFALALLDLEQQQVVLAVDPMGIERMCFSVRPNGIVFGTSAEQIARAPGITAGLNRQAVFDYLMMHIVPAPATVYEGVSKLRAGTAAVFKNGTLNIKRYWQPQFEEGRQDVAALRQELHDSLHAAVESCAPDATTGAFLSGGLDSSSVTGMFAKVRGPGAPTFSMGFGVDAYDELSYARIANKHFGTKGHEYHVTADDIVAAFPKIAQAYDEPFGNSSAVPTYICAKVAREHGMDHLLAGDGGDEIFGGNERYVRQQVFERYFDIPGWLRTGLIGPLARVVPPVGPLRKVRSYVDQASVRLPERFESWNFMYRQGAANVFDAAFLSSINPRGAIATMEEVYHELEGASLLNRMLFYDWHYTLADNDLRKVNTMCELAGIRVSYPMLDRRVIDLSLRVPSSVKIANNELRAFYKDAMSNFLPQEILTKEKHGFGLPFGVWLKTHAPLRELIFGHLESLRRRQIVRPAFIDDIVKGHSTGNASFYGYPIWDMAMLDAWLTAHGTPS